jgi:hypothetical protein
MQDDYIGVRLHSSGKLALCFILPMNADQHRIRCYLTHITLIRVSEINYILLAGIL